MNRAKYQPTPPAYGEAPLPGKQSWKKNRQNISFLKKERSDARNAMSAAVVGTFAHTQAKTRLVAAENRLRQAGINF